MSGGAEGGGSSQGAKAVIIAAAITASGGIVVAIIYIIANVIGLQPAVPPSPAPSMGSIPTVDQPPAPPTTQTVDPPTYQPQPTKAAPIQSTPTVRTPAPIPVPPQDNAAPQLPAPNNDGGQPIYTPSAGPWQEIAQYKANIFADPDMSAVTGETVVGQRYSTVCRIAPSPEQPGSVKNGGWYHLATGGYVAANTFENGPMPNDNPYDPNVAIC